MNLQTISFDLFWKAPQLRIRDLHRQPHQRDLAVEFLNHSSEAGTSHLKPLSEIYSKKSKAIYKIDNEE
jgi:hypothetical protein